MTNIIDRLLSFVLILSAFLVTLDSNGTYRLMLMFLLFLVAMIFFVGAGLGQFSQNRLDRTVIHFKIATILFALYYIFLIALSITKS